MSWAKIDDHANEHRKQLAAGAEACWLWTCGLMYSNRQSIRNGFIPEKIVSMLYPNGSEKKVAQLAKKLVNAGLWIAVEGGFQVHEFDVWNQSKEQHDHALAEGRRRAAESYLRAKNKKSSGEEGERRTIEENTILQNSSGSLSTPLPLPDQILPPPPLVGPPLGADIAKTDLDSFAPDPPKSKAKKPRAAQWRKFPMDFEPDDSHRQIASELGIDLEAQLVLIRDWEFNPPKSDAAATFRNWLRRVPQFEPKRSGVRRAYQPKQGDHGQTGFEGTHLTGSDPYESNNHR